jgi:hypothetical protein
LTTKNISNLLEIAENINHQKMDFLFVLKSDNINGQKIEKKWKTYV